jgi:hypothetical protein
MRGALQKWYHFNYFRGHSSALGFQRAVRLRFERVKTVLQCGV